ncbi:MAG: YitT family protein [Romboutsia sp.]|uniref:YitT family protein n=1 Tax=Romboutsia sp. TaxID=1965302 RepID=UPI003F3E1F6B
MEEGKSRKNILKDILFIMIGNMCIGFSYANWMVPNEIINGGVTSLSLILREVLNIPILYLSNGITILLLIVCLIFLGKENFSKSIASSFFYSFFFSLFHTMSLDITINIGVDLLLASVGIAFGYYCCISRNASTVGMDVIAIILHRKNEKIDIAKSIRYINFLVLAFGCMVYGFKAIIIGIIFTFINSYILDLLLKKKIKFNKLNENDIGEHLHESGNI